MEKIHHEPLDFSQFSFCSLQIEYASLTGFLCAVGSRCLWSRPDVVETWDDTEVARRWLILCPVRKAYDPCVP